LDGPKLRREAVFVIGPSHAQLRHPPRRPQRSS